MMDYLWYYGWTVIRIFFLNFHTIFDIDYDVHITFYQLRFTHPIRILKAEYNIHTYIRIGSVFETCFLSTQIKLKIRILNSVATKRRLNSQCFAI